MKLHLVAGSTADGPFETVVTPELAGWRYAGLRVLALPPGGRHTVHTGPDEMLVLPLAGAATVECAGQRFELAGRAGVFDRVTDFAYLPRDAVASVSSAGGGRFALPAARARRELPPRYGPAEWAPVEVRGAGSATRQVTNFCAPGAFETDRLTAVEVLTPAGNWSSYPPHKHDEPGPGEAVLEEIYYFEVAAGPAGGPDPAGAADGMGYQRVYPSGPDRTADVCAEVRSGDVVLVPHGYHGPSMAPPGYHLYYLNVLAGPAAERTMAFRDDPGLAWIRASWAGQVTDPRVPMTSAEGRPG
jgi:5-deoxy-glucuronate isomerase